MFKFKNNVLMLIAFISIFTLSGCSEKLDMKTGESISSSMDKVLLNKTEEEIFVFQDAYETILGYAYTKTHNGKILTEENSIEMLAEIMRGNEIEIKAVEDMHKLADSILDGMTYEDVVDAREKYEKMIFELADERDRKLL